MRSFAERSLNEVGIIRQVEFGRRQVKTDGFLDIEAGFRFRFTSRSATRQFRTRRREALNLAIIFKYDVELHVTSIRGPGCAGRGSVGGDFKVGIAELLIYEALLRVGRFPST